MGTNSFRPLLVSLRPTCGSNTNSDGGCHLGWFPRQYVSSDGLNSGFCSIVHIERRTPLGLAKSKNFTESESPSLLLLLLSLAIQKSLITTAAMGSIIFSGEFELP
jgi:hypothetical protein